MENSQVLGARGMIRRSELTRVIIQSLYSLGYKKAASSLESESGISSESTEYALLRSQILDGRWNDCIQTLNMIEGLVEETRASACFLILRQWFLDFLNSGDDSSALWVLQKLISPLSVDKKKIHELACGVVSMREIGWGVKDDTSVVDLRRKLLIEFKRLLPPPITIPDRRLEHLIETALTFQQDSCMYHNSSDSVSLYEDHCCGRDQLPTETTQILNQHENEVWFVQFSNNGEYLASSSSDFTAIVWTVSKDGIVSLKHTLRSHKNPVSFVAWSPDDTMLLTCGSNEVLKLWDVETGTCKHTFGKQSPIVSSCAWFPDSKRVICCSCDPVKCIYMWDLEGNELDAWKGARMPKVSDLAVTPSGEHLISICADKDIQIYNFRTRTERIISEKVPITSLSVSKDGQFLIVNLHSEEIHMWDVTRTWELPLKYTGHKQRKYVIRSCFGGLNCAFIASGSENSQIYIWHRQSCRLLEVLPGHTMTVNCVSWNPSRPQMLASASDDHTIRIWGAASKSKPAEGSA